MGNYAVYTILVYKFLIRLKNKPSHVNETKKIICSKEIVQ